MKLTNRLGLPEAIYDAVRLDDYDKGDADYSISGLLEPPRIAVLKKQHWDSLEEDVSDRIFALFGHVGHGILERSKSNRPGDLVEHRFFTSVDVDGKPVKLSGKTDNLTLDSGILNDYKFTTVWKVADGLPLEYEQQTNMYVTLLEDNKLDIKEVNILVFLRDWSIGRARRDAAFPQQQVLKLPVPIWHKDDRLAFITTRIKLHQQARLNLPECSPGERWERGKVWAVMKKGRKTSVKNFLTEAEAFSFMSAAKDRAYLFIQEREAEQVRCLDYCPVAAHCTQWRAHPTNPLNKLIEAHADSGESQ